MRRLPELFEAAAQTRRRTLDVEVYKELHDAGDAAIKFEGRADMMTNHVHPLAPVSVVYGSEEMCACTHILADFDLDLGQFFGRLCRILQQRQQGFSSESHRDPDALEREMAVIKK